MNRLPMLLTLVAGCTSVPSDLHPVSQSALPQAFVLDMTDPLVPGSPVTVTVTGAPPNSALVLVQTDGVIGQGICPRALGGECMDITAGNSGYNLLPVPLNTDASGNATFSGRLPASIPRPQAWVFQAVHVGSLTASTPIARDVNAGACVDDANEEDDDASAATPIVQGVASSGTICPGDTDWYSFDGFAGDVFTGEVAFSSGNDVDARLLDDAGVELERTTFNFSSPDVFEPTTLAADGTHYIEVLIDSAQPTISVGSTYDLSFELTTPDVCPVDLFEPNDTSFTATPIAPGFYPDLGGCFYIGQNPEDRYDWYELFVPAGNRLTVDLLFDDAEGDLDLYLFDVQPSNANIDNGFLERGWSSTDNERVRLDVMADTTFYVAARVFADAGVSVEDGNLYDLVIDVVPLSP